MASKEISALKDVVMNVVNGITSPATLLVQQAQEQAANVMAELKYTAEQTKVVVPQQAKIGGEIAKLESLKLKNTGLIEAKNLEVMPIDKAIEVQENTLETIKKVQAAAKDANSKAAARAKAKGKEYKEPNVPGDQTVDGIRSALEKQYELSKKIHDEIDRLEKENKDYDEEISKKQYELKILAAQLNPSGALMEAQAKFTQAQAKLMAAQAQTSLGEVNSTTQSVDATSQETKENSVEAAQKDLEAAQKEQETMQQVSDEHDQSVEQTKEQNDPKMMQLRAEFQVMDASVTAINYLVTNIGTLSTMISSTPSTLVAGSAVGTANPAFLIPWGNVLYGFAWAILANAKAASIRFLAIAQEIDYTPKEENATINGITAAEGALMGLSSIAPAGASLK